MYSRQLDTFICAADAGSFSKAAERLNVSATAIMKQINLLESSLDVQLFARSSRGLSLTDAGKSYYQDARYMLRYAGEARTRAQNAMQSNDNIIRIGTSLMTPHQFLMDLWPKIHRLEPELKFQIVNFENTPENAREILARLGENIDVVAGIFDETMLSLRGCTAFEPPADLLRGIHLSPACPKGKADGLRPVRSGSDAHQAGVERPGGQAAG